MRTHRNHRCGQRAFSLVEVVLAIGIVAFAVTVIFGLLGALSSSDKDNRDRNDLLASLEDVRQYLQTGVPFATCYGWAVGGAAPDLVRVTYRADDSGNPNPNSSRVRSIVFDPASPPYGTTALEAARDGRWVKIHPVFSPELTPGGDQLPGSSDLFPHSGLVFQAEMAVVAGLDVPLPQKITFRPPISVNR